MPLLGGPRSRLAKRNATKMAKLDAMIARYVEDVEDQQLQLDELMGSFRAGKLTKGGLQVRKNQLRTKLRNLNNGLGKLRRARLNLGRAVRDEQEDLAEDEAVDEYLDNEEARAARKQSRRGKSEEAPTEDQDAPSSTKSAKKKPAAPKRNAEEAKVYSFTKAFVKAYRHAAKEQEGGPGLDLVREYPFSVTYMPHKGEFLVLFSNPKSERLDSMLLPEGQLDLSRHGAVIRTCFLDVGDWSDDAAGRAADGLLRKDLS